MFVPGPIGQVATGSVTRQTRTTRQGIFKRKVELPVKLLHFAMKLRRLAVFKIAQVIQTEYIRSTSLQFPRAPPIGPVE